MKKVIFLLGLFLVLTSCTVDPVSSSPCGGNCEGTFRIDVAQNPGSYQDPQGTWHIKYSGLNYFRIKGQLTDVKPEYVVNGVPLVETDYDSNYFYVPNQIKWTYPVYSYLGLLNNNVLTQSIPVGYQTYTLPRILEDTSVSNLAGYEINKYFNFNHPAAQTMLHTYSKYTLKPQQQMVFFPDMVGDEANIYIRVLFNSDFGGDREEKVYTIHVKFEN
jgi:hypothetical protein